MKDTSLFRRLIQRAKDYLMIEEETTEISRFYEVIQRGKNVEAFEKSQYYSMVMDWMEEYTVECLIELREHVQSDPDTLAALVNRWRAAEGMMSRIQAQIEEAKAARREAVAQFPQIQQQQQYEEMIK